MGRKMMTYGTLPSREEFDAAFERECRVKSVPLGGGLAGRARKRVFAFTNDPRVGTCELTASELWAELEKARAEWEAQEPENCACTDRRKDPDCPEAAGQWCSDVLGVLGFEWV